MLKATRSLTSKSTTLRLRPLALLSTRPCPRPRPRPRLSSLSPLARIRSRTLNIPRTTPSSLCDSRPSSMATSLRCHMLLRPFASLRPSLRPKLSPHRSWTLQSSAWASERRMLQIPALLRQCCLRKHPLHLSSLWQLPPLRRRQRPRLPSLGRRSAPVPGSRVLLHWPVHFRRSTLQTQRRPTAKRGQPCLQYDGRA